MTDPLNIVDGTGDGAKFTPKYHNTEQGMVLVPVIDLQDAKATSLEERGLLSVGAFFLSGSFWLGIERLATEGWADQALHTCVICFVAGIALTLVGWRQEARRVGRLARFIPKSAEGKGRKGKDGIARKVGHGDAAGQ